MELADAGRETRGYGNDGFESNPPIVTTFTSADSETYFDNGRQISSDSMSSRNSITKKLRIESNSIREFLAECLGTFVLMVFGNGSVAQSVLSKGGDGNFLTIYWAYGLGVTMGVYIAGGVSGAHLNPAVSVSMSALGKLPWKKLPVYATGQLLGAFLSGPVVYGIYYGPNGTASIFATYPKEYLSITNGFFDQIFATALLLGGILAITDNRNNKPTSGMEPLLVGLLVFALGNAYGTNCGYAINPARDLGPRIFTSIAGWGAEVFTAPNYEYWFWVPIVAPILGGLLGSFVYVMMIELHWPIIDPQDSKRDGYHGEVQKARDDEGRLLQTDNQNQGSEESPL